jgi:hypothetical protein
MTQALPRARAREEREASVLAFVDRQLDLFAKHTPITHGVSGCYGHVSSARSIFRDRAAWR